MAIVSRVVKPKSKRAKRALEKREPKVALLLLLSLLFTYLKNTVVSGVITLNDNICKNLTLLMARVR